MGARERPSKVRTGQPKNKAQIDRSKKEGNWRDSPSRDNCVYHVQLNNVIFGHYFCLDYLIRTNLYIFSSWLSIFDFLYLMMRFYATKQPNPVDFLYWSGAAFGCRSISSQLVLTANGVCYRLVAVVVPISFFLKRAIQFENFLSGLCFKSIWWSRQCVVAGHDCTLSKLSGGGEGLVLNDASNQWN